MRTRRLSRKRFDHQPAGLVLLQLDLSDGAGIAFLNELQDLPDVEVIVNSGEEELDIAVEAFRGGALDYLIRPIDPRALRRVATKAAHSMNLNREVSKLRRELRKTGRFGKMVGQSEVLQNVYELIGKVAPTSSTVLIIGETGTGKELVAETIHEISRRSHKLATLESCGGDKKGAARTLGISVKTLRLSQIVLLP